MTLLKRCANLPTSQDSPPSLKKRRKVVQIQTRPSGDLSSFEKLALCTPIVSAICRYLNAKDFARLQNVAPSWRQMIGRQKLMLLDVDIAKPHNIVRCLRWLAKYQPNVQVIRGFSFVPIGPSHFKNLVEISLSYDAKRIDAILGLLENNQGSLKKLNLSGMIEGWCEGIWQKMPSGIEFLDLSALQFYNNSSAAAWLQSPIPTFPHLKNLILPEFRSTQVPRNLYRLIEAAEILEAITIPVAKEYDENSIRALISKAETLLNFHIHPCTQHSYCNQGQEHQLVGLLGHFPHLRTFSKDCISEESADSLLYALAGRPRLVSLEFEGTGLTKEGLLTASKTFFNLRSLTLIKVNSEVDLSALDVIPRLEFLEIQALHQQRINLNLPLETLVVQSFNFSHLKQPQKRISFECGSYVRKTLKHLTLKGERESFDGLRTGLLLKATELQSLSLYMWGESGQSAATSKLIALLFKKLPNFIKVSLHHNRGSIVQIVTRDGISELPETKRINDDRFADMY